MIRRMCFLMSVSALAGCLTVSQSEYPAVELTPAPAESPAVAISGFEATVTTLQPIYGYATVWGSNPGYYRHGHYYRGWDYPQTVSTTTYVPQTQLTTAYAEKAQDGLEKAGFVVSATNAACCVNVRFAGPHVTDGDRTAEFFTMVLTAFTLDRTTESWTAQLKITDQASGRVIFTQDYTQDYVASAWGLVPIFGPLSSDVVQSGYIKNWCLSALTERATADATAFLAGAFKKQDN